MLLTGLMTTNPVCSKVSGVDISYIPHPSYKYGIHSRNSLFAVRVSCLAYIHCFNGMQVFQFSSKIAPLYNTTVRTFLHLIRSLFFSHSFCTRTNNLSEPQLKCFVSPSNTAVFRYWMNPRYWTNQVNQRFSKPFIKTVVTCLVWMNQLFEWMTRSLKPPSTSGLVSYLKVFYFSQHF